MWKFVLIATVSCATSPFAVDAADEDAENDSSALLPTEYASKYLVARNTLSPDQTVGVMYPKTEVCDDEEGKDCKDFLVQLKPFSILGALETKWPHFQNKNHGGIGADWSRDGSVALVTLESKWGPGDIFLYELKDGKLSRATNLLRKIHDLLEPDYRKTKTPRYNDYFDFIFESDDKPIAEFKGATVQIHARATTDPKRTPGVKAWDGKVDGVWDIPAARFSAQKVQRVFAGVRKED